MKSLILQPDNLTINSFGVIMGIADENIRLVSFIGR